MKGFNSKIWVFGAIASILLIAIIMPSVPFANSEITDWCDALMPGVDCTLCNNHKIDLGTFSNVLVLPASLLPLDEDGEPITECSLNTDKVLVTGNIQIESGAVFTTNGITVLGNIISDGASTISVAGININGNIQIENSDTDSIMSIINNEVGGNVLIKNNDVNGKNINFFRNTINGNVEFSENASSKNFLAINTINGNLDCINNTLNPVTLGLPNIVNGNLLNQCAGL